MSGLLGTIPIRTLLELIMCGSYTCMDLGHPSGGFLQRFTHVRRPQAVRPRIEGGGQFVPANLRNIYVGGREVNRTRMRTRSGARYRRKPRSRRFGRRRRFPARTLMPWKMVRVLKTVKYVALNPGAAGAIAVNTFMVNSGNDPTDTTGTGQPLGWDTLSSMYTRYSVIRSKLVVECTSADATNPIAVGLHCCDYQTAISSYEGYKEQPLSQVRLMTPEQDKILLGMGFPISRIYGHRKFLTDDRLSAVVTANPEDKVYCHLFAQPVDQTTDVGVVHAVVTMYQTIVFYQPKTFARS